MSLEINASSQMTTAASATPAPQNDFGQEPIVVGELIMLEVLQGVADERRAAEVGRPQDFIVVRMLDDGLAVRASTALPCPVRRQNHHPQDHRYGEWHLLHRTRLAPAA